MRKIQRNGLGGTKGMNVSGRTKKTVHQNEATYMRDGKDDARRGPVLPHLANEEVHRWLQMAHKLEDHAFKTSDMRLLRFVQKFVGGVVQIAQLFGAFRQTEHHQIEGPSGVAKRLNISRNAVYLRLEWVGLEAEDFREAKTDLARLVSKSSTVGPLLVELKERLLESREQKEPMPKNA